MNFAAALLSVARLFSRISRAGSCRWPEQDGSRWRTGEGGPRSVLRVRNAQTDRSSQHRLRGDRDQFNGEYRQEPERKSSLGVRFDFV